MIAQRLSNLYQDDKEEGKEKTERDLFRSSSASSSDELPAPGTVG